MHLKRLDAKHQCRCRSFIFLFSSCTRQLNCTESFCYNFMSGGILSHHKVPSFRARIRLTWIQVAGPANVAPTARTGIRSGVDTHTHNGMETKRR